MSPAIGKETAVLRALSHPMRQEILDLLAREPATSAIIARALASNTGVASYHLRELGKAGLIEHDAERSHGRQLYWRVADDDARFADPSESEQPVLARAAIDLILARFTASVRRYLERTDLDSDWREAALFSRSVVNLTAAELNELNRAYLTFVQRWTASREAPSDAKPVRLALFAFPDDPDPRRATS
jgi:DNA-binding transcriptional ArsR family regulator